MPPLRDACLFNYVLYSGLFFSLYYPRCTRKKLFTYCCVMEKKTLLVWKLFMFLFFQKAVLRIIFKFNRLTCAKHTGYIVQSCGVKKWGKDLAQV